MSCLRIIIIFFTLFTYFLVEPADLNYMNTTITDYLSETRHHDSPYMSYKNSTKKYIYDEFEKFGLETDYDTFRQPNVSSTAQFHTVIGVLRGTKFGTKDDAILGVGAHYDTVNTTKGVDENGSGVAALLEVTRQITELNKNGTKRGNTIIFVSFDLEEENNYGSEHFIHTWLDNWLRKHYRSRLNPHGIIILDTLMNYNTTNYSQDLPPTYKDNFKETYESIKSRGSRGDFLSLIFRKPTDDTKLANAFKTEWNNIESLQYKIELFPLPLTDVSSLNLENQYTIFLTSDHVSFWKANLPAIMLSDTEDLRGIMKSCYLEACDNLATMLTDDNINFLGKTADATAMTIHKLSEPTSGDSSGGLSLGISITTTIIAAVVVWLRNQITFA